MAPPGRWPLLAYRVVVLAGWCAVNALAAIGVIIALFIVMANASFAGFFREAGNLSAHYLAAAPEAQRAFAQLVSWLFAGAFAVLAAIRFRGLREGLRAGADAAPRAAAAFASQGA